MFLESELSLYFQFLLVVAVFVLYLIIKKHPEMTLPMFFATQFLFITFYKPGQIRELGVCKIAFFSLSLLALTLTRGKLPRIKTAMDYPIIGLGLMTLIWAGLGLFNGFSLFDIAADSFKFVEIIVIYYLAVITLNSEERLQKGLKGLGLTMVTLIVLELSLTPRGGFGLLLATLLVPGMFVAVIEGKHYKWLNLAVILGITSVILCYTRSYWIGFVISMCVAWLFIQSKYKLRGLFYLIILIPVLLFLANELYVFNPLYVASEESFLNVFTERALSISNFTETGGYRFAELQLALAYISQKPLLGWGFGFVKTAWLPGMGIFRWGSMLHNYYFEILLKMGIIGLTFYVITLLYPAFQTLKLLKNSSLSPLQRAIAIGGIAAGIGWCFIILAAPPSTYGHIFLVLSIPLLATKVRGN